MFEGKDEKRLKKEVEICLNCPLVKCSGERYCYHLRTELRKWQKEETVKERKMLQISIINSTHIQIAETDRHLFDMVKPYIEKHSLKNSEITARGYDVYGMSFELLNFIKDLSTFIDIKIY